MVTQIALFDNNIIENVELKESEIIKENIEIVQSIKEKNDKLKKGELPTFIE